MNFLSKLFLPGVKPLTPLSSYQSESKLLHLLSSMEPGGESSGSAKPIEELWAKLVSVDSRYSAIEICSNEMVICSEVMRSSLDKYEWCKITRSDRCSANVRNISLQTISVNGNFLEKEDEAIIKCGAEIISGPEEEGYMTYRFEVMPIPEHCKKQLKISLDIELAKCEICSNIWNDVITVSPCFHNFCNGCFSEWLRSQEEDESVLCPQCQSVVDYFGKNQFLHRIEEEIMESDPSLKRSREQVECLEGNTSNNLELRLCSQKRTGRRNSRTKRPYSTQNEENNVKELPCPQCGTKLGGFQCDQTTAHLQCQACRGMMPSRTDTTVPQHCLGCGGSFCWAYWQAQGVVTSETHTICSCDNFKPISERTISRIPLLTHHNNHIEQNITTLCIEQMEKTLQDIISDWIMKLKNREIDRTRMPLNHAERITAGTHLCNECYEKLVSFLLYWFRITVPKDLLPPDSSTRENCWYGYECHTQHNSEEHARKLNHVCRPTRGSNA